ncbi:MAG: M48 family metalloprotease [Sulfuricellaceae bacterium]|nr:M48 family metalloprotease [Sulfuricellaceae bacterium]
MSLLTSPVVAEGLPDLGDASSSAMTPVQERRIGDSIMRDVRSSRSYLDDMEIADYLNALGRRLVENSLEPSRAFEFFVISDSTLNAFALPGGYIGVHTGLLQAAQSESELASVLAHEISHVTQRHLARLVAGTQGSAIASIAALAVAILAARSNPQVASAAIATAQATSVQTQLDFTREHEREADRIGLQILEQSRFDPQAMVSFFDRMHKFGRVYENNAPVYLRTHPLTTERIADVQNRVDSLSYRQVMDSFDFQLARARVDALERDPRQAIKYFQSTLNDGKYSNPAALHYGLAASYFRVKELDRSEKALLQAEKNGAEHYMLDSMWVRIQSAKGRPTIALERCRSALKRFPHQRTLVLACGETLLDNKMPDEATGLATDALAQNGPDARLYQLQAKASAAKGLPIQQHRALAEAFMSMGNLHEAIEQLQLAQKIKNGDFYQFSMVEARLRELQRLEMENRKREKSGGF